LPLPCCRFVDTLLPFLPPFFSLFIATKSQRHKEKHYSLNLL
jgi:hypothetical protein